MPCPLAMIFASLMICGAARPAVVDRIAVVVGSDVITQSEVLEEVRMTEFLNGQPLKLGPPELRAGAERLVDQQLIRNEMKIGSYSQPPEANVDATLAQFRKQRFGGSDAAMRASLQAYGLTEDQLEARLRWQLAALRFTNIRFHTGIPSTPQQATARARDGSVEQQLDAWLKEKRGATKIKFYPEAFQ
jgi:hypothetical protein